MGYEVRGFGHIEGEFTETEMKNIYEMFIDNPDFYNVDNVGTIYFEMSGNKGIDYEPLNNIKKQILKMGSHPFQIIVGEYQECDGGYYFDTEEEVGK